MKALIVAERGLETFENSRGAHAVADAHGHHAVAPGLVSDSTHNLLQILRLARGPAEITERNSAFTVFDYLKTAATSGSSTTAIIPPDIPSANLFGFDLL